MFVVIFSLQDARYKKNLNTLFLVVYFSFSPKKNRLILRFQITQTCFCCRLLIRFNIETPSLFALKSIVSNSDESIFSSFFKTYRNKIYRFNDKTSFHVVFSTHDWSTFSKKLYRSQNSHVLFAISLTVYAHSRLTNCNKLFTKSTYSREIIQRLLIFKLFINLHLIQNSR